MSSVRTVPPPTDATHDPAPVAEFERRVTPQAGYEEAEQREPQPPLATSVPLAATLARMRGEVALRVRHAMVQHALRAADARGPIDGGSHAVRRVLAAAPRVLLLGVELVTVAAARARILQGLLRGLGGQRRLLRWQFTPARLLQAADGVSPC